MKKPFTNIRVVMLGFLSFATLLVNESVKAEIYTDNRFILLGIREAGLKVEILDNVKDGCWQNPSSAENKAISLLNQYGLYNANSNLTFFVTALGYRLNNGLCAVRMDAKIDQIIPEGYKIYGQNSGIFTGSEASNAIRSEVESFIEELVVKLAQKGI